MESSNAVRLRQTSNELRAAVERLRLGHGLLSPAQFAAALASGDFEVWALPAGAYVLIAWGVCELGETCNILTATGAHDTAADVGLDGLEIMARARGARVIMCVARPGWTAAVRRHGYTVTRKILFTKVLEP